jgi:GDSL-like lipase/acylhydrolase family protein
VFTSQKLAIPAGVFLTVSGLFANVRLLTYLLSPDGHLIQATKVFIWMSEALLISGGLLLLITRSFVKFSLVFLSLIFSIGLVELFLKKDMDLWSRFHIRNPHGTGSYRLRPNLNIHARAGKTDYIFKTNQYSMPWRDVTLKPPESKDRIAFVGDSFTFGLSADRVENSFVGVFDQHIDQNRFEVLNFGVIGYGLADEELQIKEEVLRFSPAWIFLMFCDGNDLSDTYLSLGSDGKIVGPDERDVEQRPEIQEYFKPTTAQRRAQFITNTSIYRLIHQAFNENVKSRGISEFEVPNQFGWLFWCRQPYEEIANQAKDMSIKVLSEIVQICDQHHVRLLIATIPAREQVYASREIGNSYDIRYPQLYVEQFARQRKIPYIDLLPPLRQYLKNHPDQLYVPGDGHFNNEGHRIAGQILFKYFSQIN